MFKFSLRKKGMSVLCRAVLLIFLGVFFMVAKSAKAETTTVFVTLQTNYGKIKIELFPEKAPVTVENFLKYAEAGLYDNTIFHRVIADFMIQGGGYDTSFVERKSFAPIKNEAANGLKNMRGTIAMARTSEPHSASSQFFINVKNNDFLDYTSPTERGYGYAVFGKVVEGMEIVDRISKTATTVQKRMADVPVDPIIIQSVSIEHKAAKAESKVADNATSKPAAPTKKPTKTNK